jgi:hypothetical protein
MISLTMLATASWLGMAMACASAEGGIDEGTGGSYGMGGATSAGGSSSQNLTDAAADHDNVSADATPNPSDGGTSGAAGEGGVAPGTGGAGGTGDAEPAEDANAAAEQPVLVGLKEQCKLISNRNIDDPTPNDTHHRANLRGTDLGISVAHGNDLYLFFGDTAGAQVIWPLGPESLPDAVGYAAVPHSAVADDPSLLCSNLRFLLTGGQTGSVQGDFAGTSMQPPPGHAISEFIHNPAGPRGMNVFPHLPGDFEVPSGAFSFGGSLYVFYTTVNLDPFEMRGSYLAKWDTPSTAGKPDYRILYQVDQRFDSHGPLRGNFINIAAMVEAPYVYLYGTGKYRASPVHLARKLLSSLDSPGGFESYDALTGTWVAAQAPAAPIVGMPAIGELSVQHFPTINQYVMMDAEPLGIIARFADSPEGPWSSGVPVASMIDPLFALKYCCINNDCLGERLMNCDRAGFYGTYMLPDVILNPDDSFSITFTMSTWDPYNVALMTATFK